MTTGRPLIATTDGSPHSHRVLPHAALLADALDAPLVLVSVLDGPPDATLNELKSTLSRLGLDGEARVEPRESGEKTAVALLRVVTRANAAVLALDSRGHGALRHALHGSVALDVLKEAEVPLLVSGPNVEPPPAGGLPYRLIVASDGSEESRAIFHVLSPLLIAGRFALTLVRVHETEPAGMDNDAALERCRRELRDARSLLPATLEVRTEVREIARGGGVDTAIIETALAQSAHAVAMSTHGHDARRHVVLGSMAMTMLGRSPVPLLLARRRGVA